MDFIIKNNHDREKRSIKINYNGEVKTLYIRKLNTSLAIRLSEIIDKMEEIKDKGQDIKTLRQIYNLFIEFLKLTILNFEEVKDVIFDLPIEEDFIKSFIDKIQEKMLLSDGVDENLKKKTRRYTKKKLK